MDKSLKRTRVLLVDDDADQLMLLSALLERENFEVLPATSAEDALSLLHSHPVDVVVTDIVMPEFDGLDLARELKNVPGCSRVPVVLLTAGVEAVDFTAHEYRADAFCLKQNLRNSLLPTLRSLVPKADQENGTTPPAA